MVSECTNFTPIKIIIKMVLNKEKFLDREDFRIFVSVKKFSKVFKGASSHYK